MWRLTAWFMVVVALAWGLTWLANHPGTITIEWLGWRVEDMPVGLAIAALLIALLVAWLLLRLIRFVIGAPFVAADFFRLRRRRRAMESLSTGLAALLAGDAAGALRAAQKAAQLAPGEPMAKLLHARAALAAGDEYAARYHLLQLKENPQTEAAAMQGLFELAMRKGDVQGARDIALKAYGRNPALPWAAQALLKFAAMQGDWPQVRTLLQDMRRHKLIDKAEERRKLAVAFTAEALALEESAPEKALPLALQAHKLDPALVPAAVVAGRLLAAAGKLRKAAKILEKTWTLSPHADIAEVYAHLRAGDSPRDRLARVRQLRKRAGGGEEGAVALARAAIDAHDWDTALGALRPWLNENPDARIFLLMAELEEARSGDIGRMREWLRRARRARPGPAWVADGLVSPQWLPVSPSGEIGAFTWREPPASGARVLEEPVPAEWLEPPATATSEEAGEGAPLIEARVKGEEGEEEKEARAAETVSEKPAAPEAAETPPTPEAAEVAKEVAPAPKAAGEERAAPPREAEPVAIPGEAKKPAAEAPTPKVAGIEMPPRAEAVADLPEEAPPRPPLPDDPGPPRRDE